MPLISPSALLYAHLVQQPPTRPSHRHISEARPINVNTSSLTYANGSSLVRIGDTTVVCGVRAEILPSSNIANYREQPSSSFTSTPQDSLEESDEEDYHCIPRYSLLVPNIDLSTGSSALFPPNAPPSTTAQSLTTRLARLLHSTKLIRPSSLKIFYTPPAELHIDLPDQEISTDPQVKAFWVLYIDLVSLSHSNISTTFDTAWLALYAALKDTILPRTWWDPDLESIVCSPDISKTRILGDELCGMPVPLSWSVYVAEKRVRRGNDASGREKWVLVDPDGFEEGCCAESGTVTVDMSKGDAESGGTRLVKLEKSGGTSVAGQDLKELVTVAEKRWQEFRDVLEGSIPKR